MTRSSPSPPCYYLVGTSGYPNYGDELIAAAWLEYLASAAPEAEVWLDCPHPGTAAVLFDGTHPHARFVDTFWQLAWSAPIDEPMDVSVWAQHAINNPGLAARWAAGIEVAARADIVHVIGGGYVNDRAPRHVAVLAAAAAAVRRSGGRAALTGLGLAPMGNSSARTVAALVDRFDVLDVRDERSAEILGRPDCFGTDDVFLRSGLPLAANAADAPRYMLCLQSDHLDHKQVRNLAAFVLATLRSWKVAPDDVGVVEGIPGQDRAIYSLLEHELPRARFYPFVEVWEHGLPAAGHQTWLSTRFHMHLIAAAAGAAGVALSTDPDYYGTKHGSLRDLGTGWTLVADWNELPAPPTGQGLHPTRHEELSRHKQAVARSIYPSGPVSTPGPPPVAAETASAGSADRSDSAPPRGRWRRR